MGTWINGIEKKIGIYVLQFRRENVGICPVDEGRFSFMFDINEREIVDF